MIVAELGGRRFGAEQFQRSDEHQAGERDAERGQIAAAGREKRPPPQIHQRQQQQVGRQRHQGDRQPKRIDVHSAYPSDSAFRTSSSTSTHRRHFSIEAMSTVDCSCFARCSIRMR